MKRDIKIIELSMLGDDFNKYVKITVKGRENIIVYSCSKEYISDLFDGMEVTDLAGAYILYSSDNVYVGQSLNLLNRTKQHLADKHSWFENCVFLTKTDNSYGKPELDFLERQLIKKAKTSSLKHLANDSSGNTVKLPHEKQSLLENELEEFYSLLNLIGVSLFRSGKTEKPKKPAEKAKLHAKEKSKTLAGKSQALEILERKPALEYCVARGYDFSSAAVNYATFSAKKKGFWIDGNPNVINQRWFLILNDYRSREMLILEIPAGDLRSSQKGSPGFLKARKDKTKPGSVQLTIDCETLIDRESKTDLSKYLREKITY